MSNYFGFFVYNEKKQRITGNNQSASGDTIYGPWNNPYFKGGDVNTNRWSKHIGYLFPAGSVG
jgi:hypothetical protein